MTELLLQKTLNGWAPADQATAEYHAKLKPYAVIHGDFKQMRNSGFHRKFFALLNIAFENWNPESIDTKWGTPEKNFETFRKNVIILAGFGYPVFNINGTFKMEAKSISFGNMGQDEFEEVYNRVLDVLLKRIDMLKALSKQEVEDLVQKYLEFA